MGCLWYSVVCMVCCVRIFELVCFFCGVVYLDFFL